MKNMLVAEKSATIITKNTSSNESHDNEASNKNFSNISKFQKNERESHINDTSLRVSSSENEKEIKNEFSEMKINGK
jgi:hypothetical protein